MSETTQILFNSPALHSLKRDQLVKLCKIHTLKANGKNVEIIERLKAHALTLPSSDPLSIATRSEGTGPDSDDVDMEPPSPSFGHSNMPRPSEQWEVVMDDIEEAEEKDSQPGTMTSMRTVTGVAGEFGTAGSKSSSIGSSLKTLASSLGLKRAMSDKTGASHNTASSKSSLPPVDDDELSKHSTRYSRLPEPRPSDAPLADHFKFSTPDTSFGDEPLPGDGARPGKPAPADSRLSLGTAPGPTTTIRLVSTAPSRTYDYGMPDTPQLKPFATSFDLLMGSPDKGNKVPVWSLTPGGASTMSIYPALPAEDLADARAHAAVATPDQSMASISQTPTSQMRPRNDVNDLFSPTKLKPPPAEPAFVFGSPLPQHTGVTNKAFGSAAQSVLSEMNRRLSEAGAPGAKLDTNFLENRPRFDSTATSSISSNTDKSADRFAKQHEDQFAKMDSIANHYAARRPAPATRPSAGTKRKSDAAGLGAGPGVKRASSGARVVSAARRRAPIPGGFGDEDDDEEEGDVEREQDRRASKRIRVEENDGELRAGKRPSIAPSAKQERERDATRRALEAKKERRRSSMRTPRVSVAAVQAQKSKSRFGFLSSAKTAVRSLWGSSKPAASAIPKAAPPKAAPAPAKPVPALGKVIPAPVKEDAKVAEEKAPAAQQKNGSLSSGRGLFKPVSKTRPAESSQKASAPSSSIASRKSMAPSSHTRTASVTSVSSVAAARPAVAVGHQRSSSIATGATASSSLRYNTRPSAVPSTSTKASTARPSSMSAASSLGVRSSDATNVSSMGSRKPSTGIPSSTTSRLFAPTASSLAKTRNNTTTKRESTLSQITNSPGPSPRKDTPGKIFGTPLSGPLSPSLIPSPVKPTSLGLAAATLAATTGTEPKTKAPMARRPRVSRSKVIAKLGAQRAAAASGSGSTLAVPKSGLAPRVSGPAPRLRSSTGAAARRSYAGGPKARGSDVLLSAKKHARQSEQARRRTRAGGSAVGARASNAVSPGKLFAAANTSSGSAMDIDD
ncbi:hypothetical protein PENSPDRAFT_760145 [Peniophora sp. CONT]|nr:hypothetical protein PENSPDRAFT_760145 [Peniophora sp. CONT]